jgi:hypothetical protein
MFATGANATAASTQAPLELKDIGTVVAEPEATWYSPHPFTGAHAPPSAKPDPAVKVVEAASVFPTTTELMAGVKEATEELDWLVEELPVEESTPVVDRLVNS